MCILCKRLFRYQIFFKVDSLGQLLELEYQYRKLSKGRPPDSSTAVQDLLTYFAKVHIINGERGAVKLELNLFFFNSDSILTTTSRCKNERNNLFPSEH